MIKKHTHTFLYHSSVGLMIISLFLFGSGCAKKFESYRTNLDVPTDLQRVVLSIPENEKCKVEYTSEENLSFFTQFDGIDLESVPYSEVAQYRDKMAGSCTYQVEFYGTESCTSYVFSLPYIELSNGDWCKVVDEQIEYDLSTSLLSLPADNPSGVTIWDIIFTF